MFTLKTITKNGSEENLFLGNEYSIIRKSKNKEGFEFIIRILKYDSCYSDEFIKECSERAKGFIAYYKRDSNTLYKRYIPLLDENEYSIHNQYGQIFQKLYVICWDKIM